MAVQRFHTPTIADQTEELLLNFGIAHTHRVFTLDDLAAAFPQLDVKAVQDGLDHLIQRGLLINLTGRYRFKEPGSRVP